MKGDIRMADQENLQVECEHDFGAAVMGWCTCCKCGKKSRQKDIVKGGQQMDENQVNVSNTVDNTEAGEQTVETKEPKAKKKKEPKEVVTTVLSSGKTTTGNVCTITCVDCGAERIVKVQDKFQVTRCIACQKKALNKKRYENRKVNRAKKAAEAKAQPTPVK